MWVIKKRSLQKIAGYVVFLQCYHLHILHESTKKDCIVYVYILTQTVLYKLKIIPEKNVQTRMVVPPFRTPLITIIWYEQVFVLQRHICIWRDEKMSKLKLDIFILFSIDYCFVFSKKRHDCCFVFVCFRRVGGLGERVFLFVCIVWVIFVTFERSISNTIQTEQYSYIIYKVKSGQ